MNDPLIYRQNMRGSGRTSRLIKALPKGGYFVVAHSNMIPMFKDYMKQLGREGEINFVSIHSPYWMRGCRNLIVAIDHFVFESAPQKLVNALYAGLAPCGSMVMTCDFEGDVITTLHNFNLKSSWEGHKVVDSFQATYPAPMADSKPLTLHPLVDPTISEKFKKLFGRFWPL